MRRSLPIGLFVFLVSFACSGWAQEVNLMGMGDWGTGKKDQQAVARTMAEYAEKSGKKFDAMLLAGDNFYEKLESVNDRRWTTDFEEMYDAKRLNFPFYVSLGNHDYEAKKAEIEQEYSKLHPESRWKMPSKWYRVDLPQDKPVVSILMLDSNKDKLGKDWEKELAWIETQMKEIPQERWTIAVAHHPLFSNGSHGDNGVLQTTWGEIFKKYKLDIYLCGHDHDLQHLEMDEWPMSFMLVGGGGASTREMRRDNRGPFSKRMWGFAHLAITPEKAVVRYIGKDAAEAHVFERTTEGKVTVVSTTPSDKATNKPLKAVQGVGEKD